MKKLILSIALLAIATLGYAQDNDTNASVRNEWLSDFESVTVSGDIDIKFVRITGEQAPKISYDTHGEYTKFRAEVKNKSLRITEKTDSRRAERTQVTLYYTALSAMTLSGDVSAEFADVFEATMFDLVVGGGARLKAAFNIVDLQMELTGSSEATLTGAVDYLSLFASTGKVAASGLEVISAEVNSQSKADVALWVTDRFVGKTTTNGSITYKGTPSVVRGGSKFMGGNIIRVD